MTGSVLTRKAEPADIRLAYGPDRYHFGDLRLPATLPPHPVAVVIHGGFWRARYDLEHIGHLCAALTREGIATWSIEYRRLGNQGGGWPGTFEDVARGTDFLREMASSYEFDLSRVVVIGHSAGGHLALWVAGRHRLPAWSSLYRPNPLLPRAAVSLAGVLDLARAWELGLSEGVVGELMGGSPTEQPDRYEAASPIERVPLGLPQILLHGTEDDIVPFEIAERYEVAAQAAGDDVTLVPLPGAGHFELIDPESREWRVLRDSVVSLLRD